MVEAFKAYDIRGIYGVDFTKEDVYKIGYFLPILLSSNKILIGNDARESSPEIFAWLSKGIIDSGSDVYYCGLCTTPMIYWGTSKYKFSGSVMITASHNPANYNGLKISKENGIAVGYNSGLSCLLKMISENKIVVNNKKGNINKFDFKNEYLAFLQQYQTFNNKLKLSIDCSNGMSALIVKQIFGNANTYIFDTIDCTFPNHDPNPLDEKNLFFLKKTVKDSNSDLGIIFDGDADRVMFVDEKGNFIQPDLMIALLADYYSRKDIKGNALQDIRTSKSVTEYVSNKGFNMHIWRVGRAFATEKLREINGVFGGELAGHYYFKDFNYNDSAFLSTIIFLEVFNYYKNINISVSELINKIKKYYSSGEVNFKVNSDKDFIINEFYKHFNITDKAINYYDFDGIRVEFEKWWYNIRKSNTEPYLRLIIEAEDNILLNNKLNEAINFIKQYEQ